MIPLSEHAKPGMSPDERARLGAPMLACVKKGLADAQIRPHRVFGPECEHEPGEGPHGVGWRNGMSLVEFGLVALLLEVGPCLDRTA